MNFWGNCASGGVVSWILTASLLCWSGWCAGEEGSLAITSCSPPPCSPQGPRTSILQPILAGTALHMLLWLPICMEHRLSLQKCRWLHLDGALLATCPDEWEEGTSMVPGSWMEHVIRPAHLSLEKSLSCTGHYPKLLRRGSAGGKKLSKDMEAKSRKLLQASFLLINSNASPGD